MAVATKKRTKAKRKTLLVQPEQEDGVSKELREAIDRAGAAEAEMAGLAQTDEVKQYLALAKALEKDTKFIKSELDTVTPDESLVRSGDNFDLTVSEGGKNTDVTDQPGLIKFLQKEFPDEWPMLVTVPVTIMKEHLSSKQLAEFTEEVRRGRRKYNFKRKEQS